MPQGRLTREQAGEMRTLASQGWTTRQLSVRFSIGIESVRRVLRGDTFAVPGVDSFGRATSTPQMPSQEHIRAQQARLAELQAQQEASETRGDPYAGLDPLARARQELIDQGKLPARSTPPLSLIDGGELPPEEGVDPEAALGRLQGEAAKSPAVRVEGMLEDLVKGG